MVIHPGTYLDSVLLLAATRAMTSFDGVDWATAAMATPANVATLRDQGVGDRALEGATANDLVLAVLSDDDEVITTALAAGDDALFSDRPAATGSRDRAPAQSIEEAAGRLPDPKVAIVSVPGPFAALEAHRALGAGMHVLLFSDNVPLGEEVELKQRAVGLGRLVMGPGAGTAVLGGCGLGFANVVERGRVGVVAAAGTGAQEVMVLIDQWGEGCSQVIGVGGRDLSAKVGGLMAGAAVEALDADDDSDVILLVSKPPDADVGRGGRGRANHPPVVVAPVGRCGVS
ncbi:MAG: protein FdrA, partial [Acidimicrobiales bacterium]